MGLRKSGYYIVPKGAHPWPHEERIATILKEAGHVVEFIPESAHKTADIILDGVEYEIKSPRTSKPSMIEKNLKRATQQCSNVIIDSSRIKNITDRSIQSFLITKLKKQKTLKHLIFINRSHEIIDINKLA
jgi:hypothetical protein